MTKKDIGCLWDKAMTGFSEAENHRLAPEAEKRTWMFVFYAAKRILRMARRSCGRFPKPPGLEELRQEAAIHLR